MSYRYKSALLTLAIFVVVYGYYFSVVVSDLRSGAGTGHQVGLLVGTVIAIIVLQVIGHIVIAATTSDRYRPMDERERAFDRRGTAVGYILMIVGALAAASTLHLGARGPDMANAVLLAIVVAESARQLVFLILHHRSA